MALPQTGFVIHVKRKHVQSKGSGKGIRYRTVGEYSCYMNGTKIIAANMSGASIEPRGPGNNGEKGVKDSLRIRAGTYPLGTHGWNGSKYHTFNYKKNSKPRPGIYVHDTQEREAILIHRGIGFKASIGCINFTKSIAGPNDPIGPNNSFLHMDSLIKYMKNNIPNFPSVGGKPIRDAVLVIEGEP